MKSSKLAALTIVCATITRISDLPLTSRMLSLLRWTNKAINWLHGEKRFFSLVCIYDIMILTPSPLSARKTFEVGRLPSVLMSANQAFIRTLSFLAKHRKFPHEKHNKSSVSHDLSHILVHAECRQVTSVWPLTFLLINAFCCFIWSSTLTLKWNVVELYLYTYTQ